MGSGEINARDPIYYLHPTPNQGWTFLRHNNSTWLVISWLVFAIQCPAFSILFTLLMSQLFSSALLHHQQHNAFWKKVLVTVLNISWASHTPLLHTLLITSTCIDGGDPSSVCPCLQINMLAQGTVFFKSGLVLKKNLMFFFLFSYSSIYIFEIFHEIWTFVSNM